MGLRLHAQIKHEIKYGETARFNYAQEEIDNIICDLCEDKWSNGDEFGSMPTEYEISKESFSKMIATLKDMNDETFKENYLYGESELTREYVIEGFENMLAESDPNHSYIYLSWF